MRKDLGKPLGILRGILNQSLRITEHLKDCYAITWDSVCYPSESGQDSSRLETKPLPSPANNNEDFRETRCILQESLEHLQRILPWISSPPPPHEDGSRSHKNLFREKSNPSKELKESGRISKALNKVPVEALRSDRMTTSADSFERKIVASRW